MGTNVQMRISPEVELDITRFLHKEAYFLDHRKYREWLELLSDEIEYRMPLRETVEGVG
ncbi:aromatic-ring-hydroxylating dioxygenase subunit beta, partial [Neobacillus drentensis]|uniref:aromatic-ring-hydroxylating dioxygenase subunit beta n=1 Tax=Neobacillus drentensis TaxID=220684 RepID=UPI002FFF5C9D